MKKLVTSTAIVGTSSLFGALTAIVRTKLLAVFVGVAGVGLLAQIGNFLNVVTSLASLGIGVGIVKYVAEFSLDDDYPALGRLRRSGAILTWVASVVAVCIVWGLRRKIAGLLFGRPELAWAVVLSTLAAPLVIQQNFHLAVIQGLKRMRQYAMANAIGSAAGLLVLVPLVYFFRWNGAVVHLVVAAALGYLVAYLILARLWIPISGKARTGMDRKLLKKLLAYGLSSLVAGALYWVNLLIIRSVIVHKLGANANGLYQVALGISLQYLALVLSSVWTYSFPRLSELKDNNLIVSEMRSSIRLSILLVTGCASTILLIRHWLIPLLFTHEFIKAEGLFPVQLLSDLLKATAAMLGVWLLPQGRLKIWVSLDLIMNTILMGSFLLLITRIIHSEALALLSVPIAHCLAYLVHCILNYGFARKIVGFSFGDPLRGLLARSFLLIVVCGIIPSGSVPLSLGGFALVALWARFSVSLHEAKAALSIVKEKLSELRRREGA
jgi:O-antigen/teichoic acid export membrane protein